MPRILVSIISDQTIPNLLVIKELEKEYDAQVFITTQKMEREGKSQWIEQAAGLEQHSVPRIVVNENKWPDIEERLRDYGWPHDATFIVNLTGGTKVMTLAIYAYFAQVGNRIIYMPIGVNQLEELYPNSSCHPVPVYCRLNLKEYLLAHGILYKSKEKPEKSHKDLQLILKEFRKAKFDVNALNADYDNEWKTYFTGTWFEEYLYYKVKFDLQLPEDAIFMSSSLMHFNQVNPSGSDKEIDILFTLGNELYIMEAKVSLGKPAKQKEMLDKIMFKLSAVNKHFGLRSHAYVVTLADVHNGSVATKEHLLRKSKVLGITAITDRSELLSDDFSFRSKLISY